MFSLEPLLRDSEYRLCLYALHLVRVSDEYS